jgi:hypothetical protein
VSDETPRRETPSERPSIVPSLGKPVTDHL